MHFLNCLMHFLHGIGFDVKDLTEITLLGMTIVQIAPIKLDPWSSVARWLSNAIITPYTKPLSEQLDRVQDALNDMKKRQEDLEEAHLKASAIQARVRILRFGDEIRIGQRHSEESFNQVLDDMDVYEKYCLDHPLFLNNKTVETSKIIKEKYQELLESGDFL